MHHSAATRVCRYETRPSQITVQSTTGNKAKQPFQMIKLKHYHHVPGMYYYDFSYPRLEQLVCPSSATGAKLVYDFSSECCLADGGQVGQSPSGAKRWLYSGSMHTGDYSDGGAAVMAVWL